MKDLWATWDQLETAGDGQRRGLGVGITFAPFELVALIALITLVAALVLISQCRQSQARAEGEAGGACRPVDEPAAREAALREVCVTDVRVVVEGLRSR